MTTATLKPTTIRMIQAMENQGALTSGAICDFGLDRGIPFGSVSAELYSAYILGHIANLFTPEELDAATCNGPALTKLIQRIDPKLTIKTVWDSLPKE